MVANGAIAKPSNSNSYDASHLDGVSKYQVTGNNNNHLSTTESD